jgi:hypothetical protein
MYEVMEHMIETTSPANNSIKTCTKSKKEDALQEGRNVLRI